MNPTELSMSIAAVANSIAAQLSDEELELAVVAFKYLGDTLEALALHRAILEKGSHGEREGSVAEGIFLGDL